MRDHGSSARGWALSLLALSACGFSSAGAGTGVQLGDGNDDDATAGDDDGTASDPTAGTASDETAGTTSASSVGSITDPGDGGTATDTGDDAAATDSGGDSSGGNVDPCNPAPQEVHEFTMAQAIISGPMELGTHSTLGDYRFSQTAGQGTLSFLFNTQCPGTYFVWALAYDDDPLDAIGPDSADTFAVHVDAGGSSTWRYGCQSEPLMKWKWRRAQDNGAVCIDSSDTLSWNLAPGPHTVHLDNIEGGTATGNGNEPGNVAAVARVVVTNDPNYAP